MECGRRGATRTFACFARLTRLTSPSLPSTILHYSRRRTHSAGHYSYFIHSPSEVPGTSSLGGEHRMLITWNGKLLLTTAATTTHHYLLPSTTENERRSRLPLHNPRRPFLLPSSHITQPTQNPAHHRRAHILAARGSAFLTSLFLRHIPRVPSPTSCILVRDLDQRSSCPLPPPLPRPVSEYGELYFRRKSEIPNTI